MDMINKEYFVINEEEAEVVRLVFDLFTKPNDLVKGINGIVRDLIQQGIPTKRGAKVRRHRQMVRPDTHEPVSGSSTRTGGNEGMLGNRFKFPGRHLCREIFPVFSCRISSDVS